jgi:hypothetical protein
MSRETRVLRSAVSSCTPFAAFVPDEHENPKFRNAKNVRLAKIHREFAEVFGEGAMNRGNVRKWCRLFVENRYNVHDEKRGGPPSVVTDDLTERMSQKFGTSGVSITRTFFLFVGQGLSSAQEIEGVVQD